MRIVCWQTILMKHHTIFFLKIGKDVAKFVICCCHDWRFKGYDPNPLNTVTVYFAKV